MQQSYIGVAVLIVGISLSMVSCSQNQALPSKNLENIYTLVSEPHGKILKAPDGAEVFHYMTEKPSQTRLLANSACYFHPVFTPAGQRITDLAPGDHRHHRGIFLAWHTMDFRKKADFSAFGPLGPTHGWNISRADFWGWGQFAPTQGVVIKNKEIKLLRADQQHAKINIRNAWEINNQNMMNEVTDVQVRRQDGVYVMDLDYRLTPLWDLVLNHTAFGGFCVRARNDGESSYRSPQGKINLPDPHYSVPELNWPKAPWYDYNITLKNGKTVGVAVIDHPQNPPATWHNPRYVWMVNPCIVARGSIAVKQNQSLRLRYRVIIYDGPAPVEKIKKLSRSGAMSTDVFGREHVTGL